MRLVAIGLLCLISASSQAADWDQRLLPFLKTHCAGCHEGDSKKGGLELQALSRDLGEAEVFTKWLKIYDRIAAGEMPPRDAQRPQAEELKTVLAVLKEGLIAADLKRATNSQSLARRLTRAEYENTMRDLFDLHGIVLQPDLPPDGAAHGFDKHPEALDISHVNLAKYVEAADKVLQATIVTRPVPPPVIKQRVSLAESYSVRVVLMQSDAVLLKDGQPDPTLPLAGEHRHLGLREHEIIGAIDPSSTVGIFRHEDDAFDPGFRAFAAVFNGKYRVRASLWSFGWDKGKVVPARGIEAVRFSVVQLQNRGVGGGHPSFTIGFFDAPPNQPTVHEFLQWFNARDSMGFNASSLVPRRVGEQKGRALAYVGPGVACDWIEVEGPLHDEWPPRGHRLLFGDLPLVDHKPADHKGTKLPKRDLERQTSVGAKNQPEALRGIWTPRSEQPLVDADRLLAKFLPKAFRRPVSDEVRRDYLKLVEQRQTAGDCFELAMQWAYRAALCSPDFLFHVEPSESLDDYALASRLSYLLWNSMPDDELLQLAADAKLHEPHVLRTQVERLLKDAKSQRFIDDFLGQWLKLRLIAANDPDKKLYPEFSPYLQECMIAETRAYFRELLDQNLDASHLVKSNFAMLNEALAKHYGIDSVKGARVRRVSLPPDSPRGGLLTQAAVLKVTANGTTTSPVPRGAFVMDRLLGQPPEPPPSNVPAVEPDVRGATTIREMLDKHRHNAACNSCHAKIDPPGFALESFDVIGGFRTRYRSIGEGDPATRGLIDPFVPLSFRLGPPVDASGELPDGRRFKDIREFQSLIAADRERLLSNLAQQWTVYATGREVRFPDRDAVAAVVAKTVQQGGGLRTLLHEFVQSSLMQTR